MNILIKEYLEYLKNNDKSINTIKNYKVDLIDFEKYINNKNINITKVEEQHIEDYKKHLKDRSLASSTRARKITAIKSFYKYLKRKHYISTNPAEDIIAPSIKKRNPVYLTLQESIKLVNTTSDQDEPYRSRDKLMLLLFLTDALRAEELTNIKLTDIKENTLTVIGKGNKEREVFLNSDIIKALKDYLKYRHNVSEYLFISNRDKHISKRTVQYTVDKYLSKAGLDTTKYSTHKLRHTAATLMYKYGNVDIRALQEILGHESIATTQIYTHVDSEIKQDAANTLEGMFN
ncbi:MAG TPA: tyrosine-type recombinase/integrase [Bacteroidales bacterium]|nr:tyrosine-type recombinase/integrase [Bacteroidales bacterium]